ncbi:MAG: MerR family transcriptional regulator [Lamprobacter sp.]|uniref:MerR family transcriptional regulator n=1 Tax=Lamprobacter sp. TaxID=3100796 RepID=UPI002B256913|nr:MerR family transcriptional regulator [Lamprobacter sp.]MEA3639565.1 MerR family transcriptional regulator [Lamprobacter sp.]
MTESEHPLSAQTYRIGAVARLTGIPPDTLRVWERRYSVVEPIRSAAGTRLYSAEDVGRLTLIKRLVDNGDAISHVAPLTLPQLHERSRGLNLAPIPETDLPPCRVAVLGSTLPTLLARQRESGAAFGDGVELVGSFEDEHRFRHAAGDLKIDLLVLERPTIQLDRIAQITELLSESGASQGLVVYGFAPRAAVERLEAQRILAKRAPVDVAELARWCAALHGSEQSPSPEVLLEGVDLASPIPRRLYDNASLARIATSSPTVRCECPHHLVQLVSSLVAFEQYSRECENRNAEDAALHAFLHAATARARATMEAALARVVEAEGIDI